MSLYKEIKEFVRGKIQFYDDWTEDMREFATMGIADCIEDYLAEHVEQISSDQKQKEYLFDLALNWCIEPDDEFYDDDDELE